MDIAWLAVNESGSSNGTSRLVTIPSLSLGKTYTATLMDLKDEDKLTNFTFTACEYQSPLHPYDWIYILFGEMDNFFLI